MGNGTRTDYSVSNQSMHLDGPSCAEVGVKNRAHAKSVPLDNEPFDGLSQDS